MLRTLSSVFVGLFFSISMAKPCDVGVACVGARFVDSTNNTGTIKELLADGRAIIKYDDFSGYYYLSVKEMGISVPCDNDFCVNLRVNVGLKFGTVVEVFNNAKIKVRYDLHAIMAREHYYDVVSMYGTGRQEKGCFKHVCEESRYISKSDKHTGVVKETFDNGIARVFIDGYGLAPNFKSPIDDLIVTGGPTPQEEPITNLVLQDQTQILLQKQLFIPSGERCGSWGNGLLRIQCWVCQERKSNNDRILDPGTSHEPRIMIIKETKRPAANEFSLEIIDDPSIREIRCISRSSRFNIKSRKELSEILNKNGLKLLDPPPLRE